MSASQFEPLPMSASQPTATPASSDESNPVRDAIAGAIAEHKVILFMKGTPEAPACGFSARTVAALQSLADWQMNIGRDPAAARRSFERIIQAPSTLARCEVTVTPET